MDLESVRLTKVTMEKRGVELKNLMHAAARDNRVKGSRSRGFKWRKWREEQSRLIGEMACLDERIVLLKYERRTMGVSFDRAFVLCAKRALYAPVFEGIAAAARDECDPDVYELVDKSPSTASQPVT